MRVNSDVRKTQKQNKKFADTKVNCVVLCIFWYHLARLNAYLMCAIRKSTWKRNVEKIPELRFFFCFDQCKVFIIEWQTNKNNNNTRYQFKWKQLQISYTYQHQHRQAATAALTQRYVSEIDYRSIGWWGTKSPCSKPF